MLGRFRLTRNRFLLLALTLLVGLGGGVLRASGAEVGVGVVDVLAVGNDRIVWLCERRVEDGANVLRLAYCRAADSGDLAFLPLRIPALSGRVVVATVRDENLHVFFSDGAHMRFAPAGGIRSSVKRAVRGVEVGLPGRAVPRAIVADASTETLYALVSGELAVELQAKAAATGEGSEVLDASGAGDVEDVAPPPESQETADAPEVSAAAAYAFVRYERGTWLWDRWAPVGLDDESEVAAVWVRDGEFELLYRRAGSTELMHSASASREVAWSKQVGAGIPSGARELGHGWTLAGPVLVVDEGRGGAARVVGYRKDKAGWKALPPLAGSLESGAALERASALVLMESRAVVVGVSPGGVVEVGSWSVTTGEQLDEVGAVVAFAPTPDPVLDPRIRYVVPFVVFAAVLVFVFITRRDGGLFRVAVGPTQQVADLQARFFALVLDLVITAPLWGGILYLFMYDRLAALSVFEQMRNRTPALEMALPVISVVEALYGLVFEIAMRATPGKRMMGLMVVAEGGGRAGGGALVVRNLMRVLEFQFPAVAVLVFLTPSRQRLGDVLSRTLVVQRVSILPDTDGPSAEVPEADK